MVEIKEAWPVFLGRLQRNAGPVAPSMGAFANHLLEAGYSPHTIKRSLLLAARFGHWLHSRGLCLQTLDQGCIERFLAHRRNQGWVEGNGASGNLRRLLAFLQPEGHPSAPPPTAPTAIEQIQGAFSKHMVQERGVGLAWSEECLFFVHRFLHARFGEGPIQLDEIQVTDIHGFLAREAHRYHPGRTRGAVAAMRGFFKWLYACGEMSRDLSNAVPKVPVWRHATLPKSLKSQEVELLLRSCRRDTAMGRRDYAILLLLARLGLRAHEVAALTLDDIEWETFLKSGKSFGIATSPQQASTQKWIWGPSCRWPSPGLRLEVPDERDSIRGGGVPGASPFPRLQTQRSRCHLEQLRFIHGG